MICGHRHLKRCQCCNIYIQRVSCAIIATTSTPVRTPLLPAPAQVYLEQRPCQQAPQAPHPTRHQPRAPYPHRAPATGPESYPTGHQPRALYLRHRTPWGTSPAPHGAPAPGPAPPRGTSPARALHLGDTFAVIPAAKTFPWLICNSVVFPTPFPG